MVNARAVRSAEPTRERHSEQAWSGGNGVATVAGAVEASVGLVSKVDLGAGGGESIAVILLLISRLRSCHRAKEKVRRTLTACTERRGFEGLL